MGDAYRATLVEEETEDDMPPDEIELARSGERGVTRGWATTDRYRVEERASITNESPFYLMDNLGLPRRYVVQSHFEDDYCTYA